MAYMRGNRYVWSDGSQLHLWARDGYDGWDESIWAGDPVPAAERGASAPSGIGLSQEVVDEYVAMRLAELVAEGLLGTTIKRAVSNHGGNAGCAALVERGDALLRLATPVSFTSPGP